VGQRRLFGKIAEVHDFKQEIPVDFKRLGKN
jgi:hypothetical protein